MLRRFLAIFFSTLLIVGLFARPFLVLGQTAREVSLTPPELYSAELVELTRRKSADNTFVHSVVFSARMSLMMQRHTTFKFFFATHRKDIPIIRGALRMTGNDCFLKTAENFTLSDLSFVEFVAASGMEPGCFTGSNALREVTLTLESISDQPIVLPFNAINDWPNEELPFAILHPLLRMTKYPHGHYVLSDPQASAPVLRFELLAHLWGLGGVNAWLIMAAVLIGASLVSAGAGLLFFAALKPNAKLMMAGGAAVTFFGLSTIYTVANPPFHAPDEARHFLTYAKHCEMSEAPNQALKLSSDGHFRRTMCYSWEKFTAYDLGKPQPQTWPAYVGVDRLYDLGQRSGIGVHLWDLYRTIVGPKTAANVALWELRSLNSLLVSLVVGVAAFLAMAAGPPAFWCAWLAVLAIPTLPFFSLHLSNHALLMCTYIAAAFCFAALFLTNPSRKFYAGLGFLLGLGSMSGRTGLIASGTWLLLISLKEGVALGSEGDGSWRRSLKRIAAFVGGLFCPILIWWNSPYIAEFFHAPFAHFYNILFLPVAALVTNIAMFLCTLIVAWVFRVYSSAFFRRWGRLATGGIVLFVWAILFVPLRKNINLANIEGLDSTITALVYTKNVLKTFWATQGFGGMDYYLVLSFWGGFGCPEPIFASGVIQVLKALVLIGVALLLTTAYRRKDAVGFFWALGVFLVLNANLAALAYGSGAIHFNLHGRYMVGFYLLYACLAMFGYMSLGTLFFRNLGERSRYVLGTVSLLPIAIHVIAVTHILGRYF